MSNPRKGNLDPLTAALIVRRREPSSRDDRTRATRGKESKLLVLIKVLLKSTGSKRLRQPFSIPAKSESANVFRIADERFVTR